MNVKKRALISLSVGILASFSSAFFLILPCRKGLSIPNSTYTLSFCKLDLFSKPASFGYQKLYFGFIQNPWISYLILALLLSALFWLILSKLFKTKKIKGGN
jgi:hypothetical protein